TLDYATCETCQPLDGMVFKVSEAKEGVNYPVMHPRCRCTTTMNMDYSSRRARNPLTGRNYKVDGDMTYDEWIKSLTPEQKHALETTRLKESRKVQDKEQWLRYKKTLGTKVIPKSFDKFQDLKYNDKEEWTDIKKAYRYVNANPGANMNAYKCASELKSLGIKGSIHIPKKDIDMSKLKFDNKHINEDRNHNVSEKEAKLYIKNAILSITKRGGISENYYSKDGVSYVNPIEKTIKTAFGKEEFKGDALIIMEVIEKYGY
ncbi:MAG: hypothetical protein IJG06_01115, partial [Clostridia bacterium]|nr:hypothetical protein [Clostridia bacterium]